MAIFMNNLVPIKTSRLARGIRVEERVEEKVREKGVVRVIIQVLIV